LTFALSFLQNKKMNSLQRALLSEMNSLKILSEFISKT
jgi:hypothetical protein